MSFTQKKVYLIGSANGFAAADAGCGDGPAVLQKSPYLAALSQQGVDLHWQTIIKPDEADTALPAVDRVAKHCRQLAEAVAKVTAEKNFFTVLGGDHSCAIGTWSGAHSVISKQGDLGLIWIDAHMDSHTFETTTTGNIHGMPLASLLGFGVPQLTQILDKNPKFKPENISLIGVRSYESGEAELLKKLNVRIFFMDEVKQRGLEEVMAEAIAIATKKTVRYGVTLDIDSMDPHDAPGTGVAEPNGLSSKELLHALKQISGDERLLGIEIVEFDPHRDINQRTEKLVPELLAAMLGDKA